MKDRISIHVILNSKVINGKIITDLLEEKFFFKPSNMLGTKLTKNKMRKYNSERFLDYIKQEQFDDAKLSIDLNDKEQNSFSLIKGAWIPEITWLVFRLNQDLYDEYQERIVSYVDNTMKKFNGIVVRASSLNDKFWQDNKDLNFYRLEGKSLDGVHIKPDPLFENEMIVDTEYNPGHSHVVNGIWFGSCWGMWFGQDYFRYVPKNILKDFEQCFSNEVLEGGVIRILLHEDIWDYDLPENRERQFNFRKCVGIDEIAHYLEKNKESREVSDPSIELENGNFEHGGVKRIIYYYDSEGEIVPKTKASEERIFELDKAGTLIWSNTKK